VSNKIIESTFIKPVYLNYCRETGKYLVWVWPFFYKRTVLQLDGNFLRSMAKSLLTSNVHLIIWVRRFEPSGFLLTDSQHRNMHWMNSSLPHLTCTHLAVWYISSTRRAYLLSKTMAVLVGCEKTAWSLSQD
jgi:hypothetical protein